MNRTRFKPLILLLAGLLAALCLFAAFRHFTQPDGRQIAQDAEVWSADPDSGESVPGIRIPGYGTLYFAKDETEQQMTLYNPEGNPCYFEFVLYLDEQSEPIYTSDLVEPGKALTSLALDKPVPAGEHELTVQINPYALEDQSRMSGSSVRTELVVQ